MFNGWYVKSTFISYFYTHKYLNTPSLMSFFESCGWHETVGNRIVFSVLLLTKFQGSRRFFYNKYSHVFLYNCYKLFQSCWVSLITGHSTATGGKEKYRPSYMDHFEKKEQESQAQRAQPPAPVPQPVPQKQVTPPHHFQRSLMEGNFEFVSNSVLYTSVL